MNQTSTAVKAPSTLDNNKYSPMLALALRYAERGYFVFPCDELKVSLVKSWQIADKGATKDEQQVRKYWKQYPDALIGLPCGLNNLAVFDIDTKHHIKTTDTALDWLEANGVDIADCARVSTPSISDVAWVHYNQGMHIYFADPESQTGGKIKHIDVDVRAGAQYVIAPGSIVRRRIRTSKADETTNQLVEVNYHHVAGPDLLDPLLALPPLPDVVRGAIYRPASKPAPKAAARPATGPRSGVGPHRLGTYDIEGLRKRDSILDGALNGTNPDHSDCRWKVACRTAAEWIKDGWTAADLLNAYLAYPDTCGVYGAEDRGGQGQFGDYDVEREYERGQSHASPMAKPGSFSAVEMDDDEVANDNGPPERTTPGSLFARNTLFKGERAKLGGQSAAYLADNVVLDIKWLIEDRLEAATLGVLYSLPKIGKTFVAIDLVGRLANGLPWAGCKTTRTGVVYVCPEGTGGIPRRFEAWRRRMTAQGHDVSLAHIHVIYEPADLYGSDAAMNTLADAVAGFPAVYGVECSMIVVDTLRQAMPGGNESTSEDIGLVTNRLQKLKIRTGVASLILHHDGKTIGRGPVGSNAITANVDTVWHMTQTEDEKKAGTGQLHFEHTRDTKAPATIPFMRTSEVIGTDTKGKVISAGVVTIGKEEIEAEKMRVMRRDNPMAATDLTEELAEESRTDTAIGDKRPGAPNLDAKGRKVEERKPAVEKPAPTVPDGPADRARMMVEVAQAFKGEPFRANDLYDLMTGARDTAGLPEVKLTVLKAIRAGLGADKILVEEGDARARRYRLVAPVEHPTTH